MWSAEGRGSVAPIDAPTPCAGAYLRAEIIRASRRLAGPVVTSVDQAVFWSATEDSGEPVNRTRSPSQPGLVPTRRRRFRANGRRDARYDLRYALRERWECAVSGRHHKPA